MEEMGTSGMVGMSFHPEKHKDGAQGVKYSKYSRYVYSIAPNIPDFDVPYLLPKTRGLT